MHEGGGRRLCSFIKKDLKSEGKRAFSKRKRGVGPKGSGEDSRRQEKEHTARMKSPKEKKKESGCKKCIPTSKKRKTGRKKTPDVERY